MISEDEFVTFWLSGTSGSDVEKAEARALFSYMESSDDSDDVFGSDAEKAAVLMRFDHDSK